MTDMEITAKITADTEGFTDGVEAVKRSSQELEKSVKKASKEVGRDVDKTSETVKKDVDGMKERIGELVRSMELGSGKIGQAMSAFAGIGLAMEGISKVKGIATKVYDTAMQMARLADTAADTEAYLHRTFGSMTADAIAWADETAKAYGVYSQEVQAFYTQLYEALSKSLPHSQADEIAQGLTQLKYDIAAVLKWYGEDQISQWVVDVVMKGEQEPFQRLMAGRTFEQAAKAAGLWSETMTDAQRKTTMAKLLMAEYSDEVGTWTANLETASGAEGRLNASIMELQRTLGEVLSPVLATVLNGVSDLIDGFVELSEVIGRITGAGAVEVTSADLIRDISDAMAQLAVDTEDASKAAAGLAGFDKITRLSTAQTDEDKTSISDGLDSWMRLWDLDASAAETAADRLWDSILSSGLETEHELREEYGDLFAWMADQSDLDVGIKEDAVDSAWRGLESVIGRYQAALQKLGVKSSDMPRLAEASKTNAAAISEEEGLSSELERLRRSGASEESIKDIERDLEDVRRVIRDTTYDAKLYQAVVSVRTTYGTQIQSLYATLAEDLGTYTGEIAAELSEATRRELDASWEAVQTAIESIPAPVVQVDPYDDTQLYADASQWIKDNYTTIKTVLEGIPSGSSLATILDKFKEAGFDVSDSTVNTAITTLADNLATMPAPEVTVGGDTINVEPTPITVEGPTVTYSPPDIDITNLNENLNQNINQNENINVVDTDPIATAMQNSIKDLDVKAETSVTVQEHDYSSVFETMSSDIAGGLSDVGSGLTEIGQGLSGIDNAGLLEGIKTDIDKIKQDMEAVKTRSESGDRKVSDAEKAVEEANRANAEELAGYLDRVQNGDILATIELGLKKLMDDLSGGSAEQIKAKRQLQEAEAARDGWDAIEKIIRENVPRVSDYGIKKYEEYFDAGKSFADIDLYDRKWLATTYGVASEVWDAALAKRLQDAEAGRKMIEAMKASGTVAESGLLGPAAILQEMSEAVSAIVQVAAGSTGSTASAATTPTATASAAKSASYTQRYDEFPAQMQTVIEQFAEDDASWDSLPAYVLNYANALGVKGYASGGVFEPNSPVLAVLGDNTREKEVAAPYSMIVKAVKDALGSVSGGTQRIELTANVLLDGRVVAKQTYPYLIQEARRLGA